MHLHARTHTQLRVEWERFDGTLFTCPGDSGGALLWVYSPPSTDVGKDGADR